MDIFEFTQYKDAVRARVKEVRSARKHLTLQKIASLIPIQNTYLSKALNDDRTHLNEDHLFSLCRILELSSEETDYVCLLRAHSVAGDPARREFLAAKIERQRRERKLDAELRDFSSATAGKEMRFLFDPMATVVYAALSIPAVRRDPRSLCGALGLQVGALKEILRNLAALDFIVLGRDALQVVEVTGKHIHFGRDHPMMRIHQGLFKTLVNSQLARCEESDKHSVLATFTADTEAFEKIRAEFQAFLKRVEQITRKSSDDHAFQLSFDLFKWL